MKGEDNIGVPLELYQINLLLRWMKNCEQGMEIYRHISNRVEEDCKNPVIETIGYELI